MLASGLMTLRCAPVLVVLLAACVGCGGDDAIRSTDWPSEYVVGGCSCWTIGLRPPDGPNFGCASRRVTALPCSDQQFVATCRGDAWMMVCV
jgi:hypothetical protein